MFDYSSFEIKFINKAGEKVHIQDRTSGFLDPKPILREKKDYYELTYVDVNQERMMVQTDLLMELGGSFGSDIILFNRGRQTGYSVRDNKPSDDLDMFFVSGNTDYPRPIYTEPAKFDTGDMVLYIDLDAYWKAFTDEIADEGVVIIDTEEGQDKITAYDFIREIDPNRERNSYEFIEAVFCVLDGKHVGSVKALDDAIGSLICGDEYDSIASFNLDYIPKKAIEFYRTKVCCQRPEWSYFWIDKYDHSLVTYSISGTGTCCRWDTSKNVGIWYIADDTELKELSKQLDKDIIVRNCKRDLAIISDGTIYDIRCKLFSKDTLEELEDNCEIYGLFDDPELDGVDDIRIHMRDAAGAGECTAWKPEDIFKVSMY